MLCSFGKRRLFLIAVGTATISLGVGCANTMDLSAIQKYGQTAAAAQDSFNAIAADFVASCSRRRELQLKTTELATTPVERASYVDFPTPDPASPSPSASTSPIAGAPATAAPGVSPMPMPTPNFTDSDCNDASAVSSDWKHGNDIVLGYVQELGAISGVDAQPTPFTPLGSALASGNLITSAQNTAFTTLANDITQQIIAGDQRQIIADTVKKVNPDLETTIFALRQVDYAYAQVLRAEFNVTFNYYHCLIAFELTKRRLSTVPSTANSATWTCPRYSSFPLTISLALRNKVLLQRQAFSSQLNTINRHLQATVAYNGVLIGLRDTHRELYQKATSGATIGDYVAVLQKTVIPLYKDVQALQGAIK